MRLYRLDPDLLTAAANPALRIMQKSGRKSAVKLEAIFWSQLQDVAKEEKTSLSKLVFSILESDTGIRNKTSLLRCFAMDRLRRQSTRPQLEGQTFDLLALIAACPGPVAVITNERKLVAFNPSFSVLIKSVRTTGQQQDRAIQLSFSDPLPKILGRLLEEPLDIRSYHLGLQVGDNKPNYYNARFALADRSKKQDSLIVIYLEK